MGAGRARALFPPRPPVAHGGVAMTGDKKPDRIGLALSGGGFRAAFFHVGVLAHLADRRLLRRVEVISTVSGGSIVGALYYLRLKELLESTPDGQVRDEDYAEVVADVERRLRAAVQRNVRMRTFDNAWDNLRMAMRPDYSRTDRVGELLDEMLYRPLCPQGVGEEGMVEMRRIAIQPDGRPFDLAKDNEGRKARVPHLRINATSLDSGHNWRFEPGLMGEPVPDEDWGAIDKNARYRRPAGGYDGYVPWQANFPLGMAVAASAAVPLLFPPLAVSGAYDGRIQLVDGGVHDNQGVQGLLEEPRLCTRYLVSDASGQLDDDLDPAPGAVAVGKRVQSIFEDRLREQQLIAMRRDLDATILHLRRGVGAAKLDPAPPGGGGAPAPGQEADASQAFGVDPEVQRLLAQVRTDLDAFSDAEIFCLAYDGYRMAEHALDADGFPPAPPLDLPPPGDRWVFWRVAPLVAPAAAPRTKPTPLQRHLKNSSRVLGKSFNAGLPLALFTGLVVLAVIAVAGSAVLGAWWLLRRAWARVEPSVPDLPGLAWNAWTVGALALVALAVVALHAMSRRVRRALATPLRVARMPFNALGGLVGVLLAWPWRLVNRWWLALGKVERMG